MNTLEQYDRATLHITALKVKEPTRVSNGKRKQEIIMADSTGNITLTLWEQNIVILKENKSYQLNGVQIHQYRGKNELTFPLFGASIEELNDLVDVSTLVENDVW